MTFTITIRIPSFGALARRWRWAPIALIAALAALFALDGNAPGPAQAASSGPRMALTATGDINCDSPTEPATCQARYDSANPKLHEFQLRVVAAVPPIGGYSAFQTEVLPGGLSYNGDTCADEVVLEDLGATYKGGGPVVLAICPRAIGPGGEIRHAPFFDAAPPISTTNWNGAILELDFHCASEGTFTVTLTSSPPAPFGATYVDGVPALVPVKTSAPGIADSLTITCSQFQEVIINSLTNGWPAGPMAGACYQIDDLTRQETFVVCDNDTAATASQATACGKDADPLDLCTDADLSTGSIRVAMLPGSYNVTTSSAPGHTPDAHQKSCNLSSGVSAKCTFQHDPITEPWFPWDVDGNDAVAAPDFFGVLDHFGDQY